MYKQDLALNSFKKLLCQKNPKQPTLAGTENLFGESNSLSNSS